MHTACHSRSRAVLNPTRLTLKTLSLFAIFATVNVKVSTEREPPTARSNLVKSTVSTVYAISRIVIDTVG